MGVLEARIREVLKVLWIHGIHWNHEIPMNPGSVTPGIHEIHGVLVTGFTKSRGPVSGRWYRVTGAVFTGLYKGVEFIGNSQLSRSSKASRGSFPRDTVEASPSL